VLSRTIDLPSDLNVFNEDTRTIIFNPLKDDIKNNIEFVKIDWNKKVQDVLDYCFKNNISSVIIEGGTNTIYNFMNINVWDEAQVFVNPTKKFERGITAPEINLNNITPVNIGNDLLYTILNS
jgi:diaminohydroxyphosphoribosylaminopyrimidine deaminase/5-amino-6-(5-phosphoribosylamino)uracil reductase